MGGNSEAGTLRTAFVLCCLVPSPSEKGSGRGDRPHACLCPLSIGRGLGEGNCPRLLPQPLHAAMSSPFFETVFDLTAGAETLRRRPYGVIEAADGRFPPRADPSLSQKSPRSRRRCSWGRLRHRFCAGDRLWLYYNQPRRFRNFLVLRYVVSNRDTSLANRSPGDRRLRRDRSPEAKRRLVVRRRQLANLGEAAFDRLGWAPHCPSRWHRPLHQAFYGQYPSSSPELAIGTAVRDGVE